MDSFHCFGFWLVFWFFNLKDKINKPKEKDAAARGELLISAIWAGGCSNFKLPGGIQRL